MPHSITFDVSPEVGRGSLLPTIRFADRFANSLRSPIEAMSPVVGNMIEVSDDHALLSAAKHAFYGHFPLRLSPDVIWLTIARNFALHVLDHAEELRDRFVKHQGKEKLVVARPEFLPGQDNPWEELFEAFSQLVAERVGKIREWIRCDFSTTGPVERTVSDLMVMETFEPYFEYIAMAGCGIPKITLLGTPADWTQVRRRAGLLAEFGLQEWCSALEPILEQFEAASSGDVNRSFWQSIFRYHGGSGPPVLTGWLTCLFPYLQDDSKRRYPNPALQDWQQRFERDSAQTFAKSYQNPQGVGLGAYPACLTNVPLTVIWGNVECQMRIVGGLIGVSQAADDGSVQPEIGWALTHGTDRAQWTYTTSRTIFPMIFELPKRAQFRMVSDDAGIATAEARLETSLLGHCRLVLRAECANSLDMPYLRLEAFCQSNLSDVAVWREEIIAACEAQSLPFALGERSSDEWFIDPTITSTWLGSQRELRADFRLPGKSNEVLRIQMARPPRVKELHVSSVAVVRLDESSSGQDR